MWAFQDCEFDILEHRCSTATLSISSKLSWNHRNNANLRDLIAATGPSNLTQIGFKSSIFSAMWPWNLIDDLEKLYGTSSTLHHALCIISNPSAQNQRFILPRVTLKFNGWPWKPIRILFYVTLSFLHNFKAIGEFKLKLQSWNAQFGPKWAIFCSVWPQNFMDNLEKY